MATAADGDDYTYETPGGAVVKPGDSLAELREQFGKYFDDIGDVDAWCAAQRRGDTLAAPLTIDPHTPDQKLRELQAEVWRLRNLIELMTVPLDVVLRVDNLVDALEALARRVQQLEQR